MNNPTEFLEILKKANAGDPNSIRIISNIYKHHLKKILDEDIIKYLKETSHLSYSAYFLAVVYEYEGVEQNYRKAIELYEKAIELENAYAMNNLAFMYYNGKGVEHNYLKIIELLEKANELGNSYAMNNLIYLLKEQNMLIELAELYLKYGKKEQFTETINKIFSKTDYKHDNTKLINLVTKDNIEDGLDEEIIYPALLYLIKYLNTHLKYSIGGEGFNECHEHFTGLCNNNSIKN